MNVKFIFIIFTFFLLVPTIQAANLGTLQKNKNAEIKAGKTATFTILFWNADSSPSPITLEAKQIPENWTVMIRPEKFILNQSKPDSPPYDNNAEYINSPEGPIKATSVKVYVNVPQTSQLGTYEVIITAKAGNIGNLISVIQERNFKFTLEVGKPSESKGLTVQDLASDLVNRLTGMASAVAKNENALLLSITAIAIIGISWIIKRNL